MFDNGFAWFCCFVDNRFVGGSWDGSVLGPGGCQWVVSWAWAVINGSFVGWRGHQWVGFGAQAIVDGPLVGPGDRWQVVGRMGRLSVGRF